jgi:AcrR family transcriptional regulator
MDMKKRQYEMRARGEAKAATREAVLNAAIETFTAERSFSVTLGPVAQRAGVTVKTILRHFGSREALIEAAWSRAFRDAVAERSALPDDRDASLAALIAHYERRGPMVLGVLAEEDEDPRALRMCDAGRVAHRAWVEEVFGASLPAEREDRCRLIDALVVATDVYAWKLLRLDRGLSADDVHDRMQLLTGSILASATGAPQCATEGRAP